jgi:Tol biopolymer transport system component
VSDGVPGAFAELFPISASRAGYSGIAWLAGDRLVHSLVQADVQQVFVTEVGSKASRALTSGASHHSPATSGDGRALVVVRDDADRSNLWRVDPETGQEQRLTEGQFDMFQVLGPDGSEVIYTAAGDNLKLLKVPITGGAPTEVAPKPALCTGVTPDGREALCLVFGVSGDPEGVMIPLSGGEPRRITGVPGAAKLARLGPDGRSITYLVTHEGADELLSLPAAGGAPRRLLRFEGKEIEDFAWSLDGRHLAVVKVSRSGDVVLLKRSPR